MNYKIYLLNHKFILERHIVLNYKIYLLNHNFILGKYIVLNYKIYLLNHNFILEKYIILNHKIILKLVVFCTSLLNDDNKRNCLFQIISQSSAIIQRSSENFQLSRDRWSVSTNRQSSWFFWLSRLFGGLQGWKAGRELECLL